MEGDASPLTRPYLCGMNPRSIAALACCFAAVLAWAEGPASSDEKPVVITNADLAKRPKPIPGQPVVITNADLAKLKPVGVIGSSQPVLPAVPAVAPVQAPADAPSELSQPQDEPVPLDLAALARANQRLEESDPVTATNAVIAATAARADTNADGTVDEKEQKRANGRGPFATGQTDNLCLCVYGDCKPKGCNPFNQKGRIQVSSLKSKHPPSTAADVAVKPPEAPAADPPAKPPVKLPKKPKDKPPKVEIQKNGGQF